MTPDRQNAEVGHTWEYYCPVEGEATTHEIQAVNDDGAGGEILVCECEECGHRHTHRGEVFADVE